MVIELDVRHDGDLRAKKSDRAVGLVSLDHEPARPGACVPAELRDDAADDPGRILAELPQHVRDHRGSGRLAVSAADDDRAAQRDELGEKGRSGARAASDAACMGGRNDELEAGRRHRVAAQVDLDPVQGLEEDRLARLPAAHLGAPGPRNVGIRREPGAADPDEVEPSAFERTIDDGHPPSSASRTSSSAITSAASRPCEGSHRLAHSPQAFGVAEQVGDERRCPVELALIEDDGAASIREAAGVQRLVISGRVGVWNEDRRSARGGKLPDRPARPRDREVGYRERLAEVVRRRNEHVVGAFDLRTKRVVVAVPRDMQHGGPMLAERLDGELVQCLCSGETAEDREDWALGRESEPGPVPRPDRRRGGRREWGAR